jgi:hypothetical protein
MSWEVHVHSVVRTWLDELSEEERVRVDMAVQLLQERGPVLGRPFVNHIKGSRIKNLKELRPAKTSIRILFAFDPQRCAILLSGGDKEGLWRTWYPRAIEEAEQRFLKHIRQIRKED